VRRAPDSGATSARVVPDGCTDLLWRRGELEIAGPDTGHRDVPLAPGELIVGVRLRPGAARPLLGATPATAVADAQPGLRDLWGEAALRLSDSLAGAREPWQIATGLVGALQGRMKTYEPDRVAVAVADALDRPRPLGIASLAWELGYSERHLRRRVRAATGYGPKTLEQILRFRRTMEAVAPVRVPGETGARVPDWSRIAAEQGYADQAHLSRQVRRWSGASPRALVRPGPTR
jgi:AraC-like DNA-binding protein